MTNVPIQFVGVDVSKDSLDVAVRPSGQRLTVPYSAEGLRRLRDALPPADQTLIVVEATGGYERRVVSDLIDAGFRVALVNPRRVRQFAQACGQLAKTDRLDAAILALFAERMEPVPVEKSPEKQLELEQLVARRRQLIGLQTMEKNRLELTVVQLARKSIRSMLAMIDRQLHQVEDEIARLLDSDDDWRQKTELLTSVKGVKQHTAAALLADLPELGQLNRQQVGALAGLAPYNHDSGRLQGTRSIRGGRADVRTALYMAALSAMRWNPLIRQFAQRLKQHGKPFKVIITACMRKLLVLLNAILKSRTPWNLQKCPQNP
jgi:transposase